MLLHARRGIILKKKSVKINSADQNLSRFNYSQFTRDNDRYDGAWCNRRGTIVPTGQGGIPRHLRDAPAARHTATYGCKFVTEFLSEKEKNISITFFFFFHKVKQSSPNCSRLLGQTRHLYTHHLAVVLHRRGAWWPIYWRLLCIYFVGKPIYRFSMMSTFHSSIDFSTSMWQRVQSSNRCI